MVTRRKFIKYSCLTLAVLVASQRVVPQGGQSDGIKAVFLGSGQYGTQLARAFYTNWAGKDSALTLLNPKNFAALVTQSPDLVFLASTDQKSFQSLRKAAQRVEPYLSLSFLPQAGEIGKIELGENEGLITTPAIETFPYGWDPVSAVYGSLVGQGLVGVDLADLKTVTACKQGTIHGTNLPDLRNFLYALNPACSHAYVIVEYPFSPEVNLDLLTNIAGIIQEVIPRQRIFYAAPVSPKNTATIVLA